MLRTSYAHADLDLPMICAFVQRSYWGAGRRAEDICAAIAASDVVGIHDGDRQIAFARAMSDRTFHAYVLDLFVVEDRRGEGLGLRVAADLMAHPELSRVTNWMLSTRDSHGLYARLGFEETAPGRIMRLTRDAPPERVAAP